MNNTIDNISFRASIKNLTHNKNKAVFNKICKNFEKRTSQYPNDTLYITESKYGTYSWHITDKKRGEFYKGEEIFTNSIDDHIEELGEKKFTKELVNAFNAMKTERSIYKKAKPIKIELDKTKGLVNAYTKLSAAYEKDGNTIMQKRYEYLLKRNKEKSENLSSKYNNFLSMFNNKIEKLSKEFPEIKQVELYFV